MSTPAVGTGSGLPNLGPRPGGSFNRSGSMRGAPSKCSRGGSRIARVVSAVFNLNKRCHRHQETPVSLRVSVPPTGLGSGSQQCPLQAAAAGRDDHPVLPATPPARLSPRPPPGPAPGPAERGECDRTVGIASREAGREESPGAQPRASGRAQRRWRTVARGDGRGAMEPGVGGSRAEGEVALRVPLSAPRKLRAWRAGTPDGDAGARSEGRSRGERSGWQVRGTGGLEKGWGSRSRPRRGFPPPPTDITSARGRVCLGSPGAAVAPHTFR